MTLILKLTKGGASLDLNDQTNYRVAPGFVPPPVQYAPVLAGGGSANRWDGARLVDNGAKTRQFNFQVHILGDSEQAVSAKAERVGAMLAQVGDDDEPLYLEYRASTAIAAEPIWGQTGANRRYQIIAAQGVTGGQFSGPQPLRAKAIKGMTISLTLSPFAMGKPQRLCTASGGVGEDWLGTIDGVSRGLIACESTTNLFSNPIFSSATYSASWTIGSALQSTQITDPARCWLGSASAMRLVSTSSTNNALTQSLTLAASSHTISFWVRRVDGTAVTSGNCQITYNGSGQTSTYTDMGNGIYRVSATVTGTAGAAATGLLVLAENRLEVLGAQCEAKAYATPLTHSDFLGVSSSAARTAAVVKLPVSETENVSAGAGCIRVIWRPHVANTHANNQVLFDATDGTATQGLQAFFLAADDQIYFSYGGNQATTPAQTFSAFDVLILHFTWGRNGELTIYKSGVEVGNSGAFNTDALGTYLYIGSPQSGTAGRQVLGTIMDFTIWQIEPTAAEILLDYQNVYPEASAGRRVGCVPYLHTKDGDNTVDATIDASGSTGAPHENFATVQGVPGSAPAVTSLWIDAASGAGTNTCYISNWEIPYFVQPLNTIFWEQSGTAGAVTDSTANYKNTTVGTSAVAVSAAMTPTDKHRLRLIAGREFYIGARAYDNGSNLSFAFRMSLNTTAGVPVYIGTDYEPPATIGAAFWSGSISPALKIPEYKTIIPYSDNTVTQLGMYLFAKRSTGSADLRVDFAMLMPSPLMYFAPAEQETIIQGRNITTVTSSQVAAIKQISGDAIELKPALYNVLTWLHYDGASTPSTAVTDTLQYKRVYVTPRYTLL